MDREFELAVSRWNLRAILDRSLRSLSSSERTSAQIGRIELLRPAVLIADRVLESMPAIADDFYRILRIIGTTVISSPASRDELGFADRAFVLEGGRVVQQGSPHHIYLHPANEAAAAATGPINIVPIIIRGNGVESAIGAWNLANTPFQGSGVALARPEEFEIAPAGEESDLIFGIEEANFRDGRWHARGILSGNFTLHVALPGDAPDGQDAIPLVEQNPDIQLIILDLMMPRMDGREWLRWFRSLRRDSPVIIITAYKVDSDEDELKPAVILEKPFHVAELLDLVGLFCGLGTPMEPAKA